MYTAGQSCGAAERVYVPRRHSAAFLEAALPHARAYVLGDPLAAETTLGPIAQPGHVAELEALVGDAVRAGAKLLHGGRPTAAGGHGRFFEPTVLTDVPQSARAMRVEQFGPILAVQPVGADEEALPRMNDSEVGLTATV